MAWTGDMGGIQKSFTLSSHYKCRTVLSIYGPGGALADYCFHNVYSELCMKNIFDIVGADQSCNLSKLPLKSFLFLHLMKKVFRDKL